MPESVTDRPTKAHEYVFLFTKSATYYYDAAAIAEEAAWERWGAQTYSPEAEQVYGQRIKPRTKAEIEAIVGRKSVARGGFNGKTNALPGREAFRAITATRNARTVWEIATQPYPQAHFATFPEELARRCIVAGSSPKACEKCGAPWERVVERESPPASVYARNGKPEEIAAVSHPEIGKAAMGQKLQNWYNAHPARTTGWQPTCSCEQQGTGRSVVLDPFGGSGTVAQVATGNGRDSIYIDLNPAYLELASQRIGPMLCDVAVPGGSLGPDASP